MYVYTGESCKYEMFCGHLLIVACLIAGKKDAKKFKGED